MSLKGNVGLDPRDSPSDPCNPRDPRHPRFISSLGGFDLTPPRYNPAMAKIAILVDVIGPKAGETYVGK